MLLQVLDHLQSRDTDGLDVSSEVLADDVVGQKLPFDSLRVRLGFVAFIHRHNDWN